MVWSDIPPLPLVVQAKGFRVNAHQIGKRQIDQCVASIESFRESGLIAEKYLLIVNRDTRSVEFRRVVNAALEGLVSDGKAKTAELWDCNQLIKASFEAMLSRVRQLLQEHKLTLTEVAEFSEPTDILLRDVPFRLGELDIDQWGLAADRPVEDRLGNPAEVISQSPGESFTLVLAEFGMGKTTTALRTLTQFPPGSSPLFVSAATFEKRAGGSRDFLRQCVDTNRVLRAFPPEDWETIKLLIPASFERLLFDAKTTVVLIIDGLDEAVMFHHRQGIQNVFNFLYATQVPVILTMRTEFWTTRQLDFTTFEGPKQTTNRRTKRWKTVELLQWDLAEITELARRTAAKAAGSRRANLEKLVELLQSSGYEHLYGDVPRRPLFLRMILDSVAEDGVNVTRKAELMEDWIRLKIQRDIREPARKGGSRLPIVEGAQTVALTIGLAFAAMEIAAERMTVSSDGKVELIASCTLESILQRDRRLNNVLDGAGLFLSSLLLPLSTKSPEQAVRVRFAHRAFQEYFLARYLIRNPEAFAAKLLPSSVQIWKDDINAFRAGRA